MWLEELLKYRKSLAVRLRNAVQELESRHLEPVLHLGDRVFRLMRVLESVDEPGVLADFVGVPVAQAGIEELEAVPCYLEHQAHKVRNQPAVLVVKPDQNHSSRFHQLCNRLKAEKGIAGVMQHAVTDDDVKGFRPEYRTKQIHLKKCDISNLIGLAESLSQLERVQAGVCCEDGPAPSHAQKITKLACAAANLKHLGSERNLFIQQAGKYAADCLFPQARARI